MKAINRFFLFSLASLCDSHLLFSLAPFLSHLLIPSFRSHSLSLAYKKVCLKKREKVLLQMIESSKSQLVGKRMETHISDSPHNSSAWTMLLLLLATCAVGGEKRERNFSINIFFSSFCYALSFPSFPIALSFIHLRRRLTSSSFE